jgi:hypothetical protein
MLKLIVAYLLSRSPADLLALVQQIVKQLSPAHRAEVLGTLKLLDQADELGKSLEKAIES